MKILELKVSGQSITWENPFPIVAGTREWHYCRFEFSNDWSNLMSEYRFYSTADKKYHEVEMLDGRVKIPNEVLKGPRFFIAVGGMEGKTFVPTVALQIRLEKNGFGEVDEDVLSGNTGHDSVAAALMALAEECRTACAEMVEADDERKEEFPKFVPNIGENGNWYIYNPYTKEYEDSGIKAQGKDGEKGEKGNAGDKGEDGKPYAYMLTTDDDGNLYCEYADTDTPPNFVYDDSTGYVYYVTSNSTRYEVLDANIIVQKVLGQLPGATTFNLMSIDNEAGNEDLIITDAAGQEILNMSFIRDDTDTATIMTVSNVGGQSVDITIKDGKDGIDGQNGQDGKDGQDYVLTATDKNEIAELVKTLIPLGDYAKTAEVDNKISTHNTATDSHNDIRLLVQTLTNQLSALANSDDETLDQLSEIVAYIKNNKELIENVTTLKVNVSDIIDNLTTNESDKPLSANQGVILKRLIEAIEIPTDYVKSVNSILPNNNGDVSIPLNEYAKTEDIPTDYIKTVNGVAPNENGNVTISATIASPDVVDSVEEMTDENKQYVLSSTGTIWAYKDVTTTNDVTEIIETGFQEGYRLNSSGEVVSANGYVVTPIIDITQYSLPLSITLSGASWTGITQSNRNVLLRSADNTNLYRVNPITAQEHGYITSINNSDGSYTIIFTEENTIIGEFQAKYFLASGGMNALDDQTIVGTPQITLEYSEIMSGYQWVDTKVPFSGKDYGEEIAALQSEVDALKASSGGDAIPSYVMEEAEEVADKILSVRNGESLVFLAGSDFHVNIDDSVSKTAIAHMGQGMEQIRRHTTPDCIVLLGDYVDNASETVAEAKSEIKYVRNSVSEAMKGCPTLWLNGNHDCSSGIEGNRLTNNEIFSYVGSNNSNAPTIVVDDTNIVKNYGYIDFSKQKIRLIYLNTSDMVDSSTLTSYFTKAQGDWLVSEALDLSSKGDDESNWGVIVCSHHPFTSRADLKDILYGYMDKTNGSTSVTDGTISFKFEEEKDSEGKVTKEAPKAELIAHFHGHIHNFRVDTYMSPGTTDDKGNVVKGKLVSITIPNACPAQGNYYGTDITDTNNNIIGEAGSYDDGDKLREVDPDTGKSVYYYKTAGTAEDTSFCAITVDRENGKIYAHCYGAGYDREITYKEV